MKLHAEVVRYDVNGMVVARVLLDRDTSGHSRDVTITTEGDGRVDGMELSTALRAVNQ